MRSVFISWMLSAALLAQESDTVILNNAQRHYTVLDQTQDPQERRDFLALYKAKEPERRRELAEEFLKAHPQSWLLPQVYEASAKASIDLGDYQRAVRDGRFSLRLLPENPLLEVPLANVEAKQGLLDAAIQDARDALDQLEMLAAPAGHRDWSDLKPKLEASAWFVLGRVYTLQGLAGKPRLVAAADALEKAADLNSKDPEISYLRG
ncbi:MAG: tetratricopeptide repeat protein, partial [Bryobacteraceae bacterium]